jgi:catechol 2,3-dioxygenase-like lactoylglutathione lyase family enzyme
MTAPVPTVTIHLSLNVTDLPRSVEFYRAFFGVPPAKLHGDYAKFELNDPPVIFSLVPHGPGLGGSLSHLGFRVADEATLTRFRERLETAGICTQVQEGTVCGYAKQNKCWSKDPDGNFWEIYHIDEDVNPIIIRKSVEGSQARIEAISTPSGPVAWEHYVTHPFPERIPHEDATVDEVRLTGSFNSNLTNEQLRFLLGEARRVLKTGGKVVTHGLMADRLFPGAQPKLPGLATMVSRMPVHTEPMEMFIASGFTGVQIVKFTEKPWFTHDDVELREVKIIAWKPSAMLEAEARRVLYKGPFSRATAEGGYSFPRGRRVAVPLNVYNQLRLGPTSESFLFLEGSA